MVAGCADLAGRGVVTETIDTSTLPRQSPDASEILLLQANVNCEFSVDGQPLAVGRRVRVLVTKKQHKVTCKPDEYPAKDEYIQPPFDSRFAIGFTFLPEDRAAPKVAADPGPPPTATPASAPSGPGTAWAVVVGIGKYRHPQIPVLKYARNDAQAVYDYLVASSGGGFDPSHVRLLLDDEATKTNILSALGTFLPRSAVINDTVFVFYAGHGAPETDYSRREPDGFTKYLVPYDANPDDLFATGISMSEVQTIFDRIESERLVFVTDACYSGASGGRTFKALRGARDIRVTDAFIGRLAQGRGRVVITASDANETSLELDDLRHGIFTHYFVEALRGAGDTNADGRVSIREAYDYVAERVARHSKQAGGNQHPVWKGQISGEIFLGTRSR